MKKWLILVFFAGCSLEVRRADRSAPITPEVSKDSGEDAAEVAIAKPVVSSPPAREALERLKIREYCESSLAELPGESDPEALKASCKEVRMLAGCQSHEQRPIFHFQRTGSGTPQSRGRRILVFGGIHGDEQPGASVARQWMTRLTDIDPRNTWRIIPVVNPDGILLGTRTNARKVDINRNFPSADWEQEALKYWKSRVKSNPRKYPGPSPASEVETRCAVSHIQTFEPDLIIAIHTPLGVLDFDGPTVKFPKFHLPWIRLGHFPGSLGRFMWRDRKVPVLTVELKGNAFKSFDKFDRLQDISGTVALRAEKALEEKQN